MSNKLDKLVGDLNEAYGSSTTESAKITIEDHLRISEAAIT